LNIRELTYATTISEKTEKLILKKNSETINPTRTKANNEQTSELNYPESASICSSDRARSPDQDNKMKHKILVIDDDCQIRDTLATVLSLFNYDVVTAMDGRAGLEKLKSDHSFDLILLDLMMPNMTGFEFREKQLEIEALRFIPTIVMSSLPEVKEIAKKMQTKSFLNKPLDLDSLIMAISTAIASEKAQNEAILNA